MMQSTISITRTDADNKRHSIQRGRSSYLGPAGRKSVLTNNTTGRTSVIADRSRRQSIAIGAIKDRRTSNKRKTLTEAPKTIYSLDTDFKNTLYTTIRSIFLSVWTHFLSFFQPGEQKISLSCLSTKRRNATYSRVYGKKEGTGEEKEQNLSVFLTVVDALLYF